MTRMTPERYNPRGRVDPLSLAQRLVQASAVPAALGAYVGMHPHWLAQAFAHACQGLATAGAFGGAAALASGTHVRGALEDAVWLAKFAPGRSVEDIQRSLAQRRWLPASDADLVTVARDPDISFDAARAFTCDSYPGFQIFLTQDDGGATAMALVGVTSLRGIRKGHVLWHDQTPRPEVTANADGDAFETAQRPAPPDPGGRARSGARLAALEFTTLLVSLKVPEAGVYLSALGAALGAAGAWKLGQAKRGAALYETGLSHLASRAEIDHDLAEQLLAYGWRKSEVPPALDRSGGEATQLFENPDAVFFSQGRDASVLLGYTPEMTEDGNIFRAALFEHQSDGTYRLTAHTRAIRGQ